MPFHTCWIHPARELLWAENPGSWCHSLPVGEVDRAEQGVVFGGGLPQVVLKQEDGRPPDLHANLLNAVLIVDGQKERLNSFLGFYRK